MPKSGGFQFPLPSVSYGPKSRRQRRESVLALPSLATQQNFIKMHQITDTSGCFKQLLSQLTMAYQRSFKLHSHKIFLSNPFSREVESGEHVSLNAL